MLFSILRKEWIKLKLYLYLLLFLVTVLICYFAYNINYAFATIEPESMLWYKFAQLQDKPYFTLNYWYLVLATVLAFAQFLPKKVGSRIKIMAHLPLKMQDSLFLHLFIGAVFLTTLLTILSLGTLLTLYFYYPLDIVFIGLKDTFAYSFASIILYVGLCSIILEKDIKYLFLKSLLTLGFVILFIKQRYFLEDISWLILLLFMPFMALDSFYSFKEQRVKSFLYKAVLVTIIPTFIYLLYGNYKTNYAKSFTNYYIFYSNIINDFVYQKNFAGHRFEYGIKNKEVFDRKTYEAYLPFVYYKNLEIQNRLPIKIENTLFDKEIIKSSRLSFSYNPISLEPQEVEIYPLLNPQKDKGVIKFSEEAFSIKSKKAVVYEFDNKINRDLSNELTKKLTENAFSYPAINIWGKTTNMKPFDKGYLVQDSKKKLFNIKRADGIIEVTSIKYPKNISLAYIDISENRQKNLSGYAIDTNNQFYLLNWDFKFIPIDTKEFNYKTMKLQLLSNPLNYQIRYNDGKNYFAVALNSSYEVIKTIKIIKEK
ncbi:MAG: DUF4857 domain-containing protein [Arcobacteraceae bacterium]